MPASKRKSSKKEERFTVMKPGHHAARDGSPRGSKKHMKFQCLQKKNSALEDIIHICLSNFD
jgi:hypothetical protein